MFIEFAIQHTRKKLQQGKPQALNVYGEAARKLG